MISIRIVGILTVYGFTFFYRDKRNKPNVSVPSKKPPMTDARNKIIFKKRTQITDAREKLAQLAKQKDARLKLEKIRLERVSLTINSVQ